MERPSFSSLYGVLLFDLAVLSQNIPQFLLWKYYSIARYGRSRWIRGNPERLLVRSDDYRAYTIAKSGGTQKGTIKIWQSLASMRPNFIVDVGANYGEFTSSTATLDIPTMAIEANPWIADCLKLTFANRNNVSVINAAIMDSDGEMPFYFNPNYSGISSLSRETINANWAWAAENKFERCT